MNAKVYDSVTYELAQANIGNYAVLGGMGILSGFSHLSKYGAVKITGVEDGRINLKQYRRHIGSYLPEYNFRQKVMILSKSQYKELPEY